MRAEAEKLEAYIAQREEEIDPDLQHFSPASPDPWTPPEELLKKAKGEEDPEERGMLALEACEKMESLETTALEDLRFMKEALDGVQEDEDGRIVDKLNHAVKRVGEELKRRGEEEKMEVVEAQEDEEKEDVTAAAKVVDEVAQAMTEEQLAMLEEVRKEEEEQKRK